ncbi:hypothetical protein AAFF_G00341480 [Aldrovandia affinis]|uniref:Uncharacterized protein n=1 Tax=Aldrovandia affinis TaxID=143900 RepID=A0AAD7SKM2_9TELE|nr:hypothetical protein AAFF_G00341480 [Aldrovandia affinis]
MRPQRRVNGVSRSTPRAYRCPLRKRLSGGLGHRKHTRAHRTHVVFAIPPTLLSPHFPSPPLHAPARTHGPSLLPSISHATFTGCSRSSPTRNWYQAVPAAEEKREKKPEGHPGSRRNTLPCQSRIAGENHGSPVPLKDIYGTGRESGERTQSPVIKRVLKSSILPGGVNKRLAKVTSARGRGKSGGESEIRHQPGPIQTHNCGHRLLNGSRASSELGVGEAPGRRGTQKGTCRSLAPARVELRASTSTERWVNIAGRVGGDIFGPRLPGRGGKETGQSPRARLKGTLAKRWDRDSQISLMWACDPFPHTRQIERGSADRVTDTTAAQRETAGDIVPRRQGPVYRQ